MSCKKVNCRLAQEVGNLVERFPTVLPACLPAWLGSVMFVLLFVFAVRVVSNVNLKSFSIFFTFVSLARFADFYLQLKEFVVCIDVCRM